MVWMLAFAAAFSNTIVAWNFPLLGYQENAPKRKLDAPPQPSVFFKPNDVLYDVTPGPSTEALPESKLDWLIWNETAGLTIGKGSWQALYLHADTIRPEKMVSAARVVFEVYEFPAGTQVAADAAPACSFSAVARNGKPFILKQTSGPWRIEVEATPHINEWEIEDDLRFSTGFHCV